MADEANDKPDSVKRIVLVGYPGSGKTMLAIGLFNSSRRKGATISVKDPTTIDTLSRAVAEIQTNKKFAAATQLIKGTSAEQTERKAYSFDFSWRGKSFRIEFEDYAGERASNPEYRKQFDDIIGAHPDGAILLLNPGMALFKQPSDVPDDKVQGEVKKWAALPKSYTAVVQKLCERGCTNLVLAVTASDRISKGGDLYQTKQYENFKKVLEEIRRSFKNVRTKDGRRLDFKIVYVTVTGRLKYNENGEPEEEHLAEYGISTAADPFLWIIDPWRRWWHKFIRRLAWLVPSAALLLAGMYFGGQAVQRHVVKSNLDKAEDLLGNFGDPESPIFDKETGTNTIAEAEASLKKANEAWTFLVSEEVKKDRDGRLSTLLGTLMTNQVKLAYVNFPQDASTYFDPNITLEGRPELASWPYWARSSRGQASHDAALGFRDEKTKELVQETLKSNVQYLINEFDKIIRERDDKDPNDTDINRILVQTSNCLSYNPQLRAQLETMRDEGLKIWKLKLAKRIEGDGADRVMSRILTTITDDTGLDVSRLQEEIFASHKRELLTVYENQANEYMCKIAKASDLQTAVHLLVEYLHQDAQSPYKGKVLEAASRKCKKVVSDTLYSKAGRKDGFECIFQAARHLHKNLDTKVFCEDMLGDNVLYWLAPTNRDGWPQDSRGWLRYTFHCDAVAVRTDHASSNPGAKRFAQNVDAMLNVSFEPQQNGYPKDIGGKWFLCYKKWGGEKDIQDGASWIPIPNSSIDIEMGATDVLKIEVKEGEEDWRINTDIPSCPIDFWPGWGDYETAFCYKSKEDVYPNVVYYGVHLLNIRLEGGPKQAFTNALDKAKTREKALKDTRNKEASDADSFLRSQESGGHE